MPHPTWVQAEGQEQETETSGNVWYYTSLLGSSENWSSVKQQTDCKHARTEGYLKKEHSKVEAYTFGLLKSEVIKKGVQMFEKNHNETLLSKIHFTHTLAGKKFNVPKA